MPPIFPPEYQTYRAAVRAVVGGMGDDASASDRAQGAAHTILNIETTQGSQLLIVDEQPHLFTAIGHRLIPIEHNHPLWAMHLAMVYGINVKDREVSPKITSWLASYTLYHGVRKTARRWTAFTDGALHLSQYNGRVMRLTGAGVAPFDPRYPIESPLIDDGWRRPPPTIVNPACGVVSVEIQDNGTQVLFADDDDGSVPENPVIGRNGGLFNMLRGISWAQGTLGGLRPKHQVQTMMIWMLMLPFADLFPTKPILMAEGAPGSGKTTTLQMIRQAIVGNGELFTASEDGLRDFWVALMRSPLLILDNTDDVIKWLPDQLNAYVTGAGRGERRLHTNTGQVKIKPHGFISVASQDPRSFRRGDTADRMIVLRMARRSGGQNAARIAANVTAMRPRIYGEWLYYLNRVVAALALEPPRDTTSRLGDFEVFAYAACRALGWRNDVIVPELMHALQRERMAFAAETDIVLDVLGDWVTTPGNLGRAMSLRELFRQLNDRAKTADKPFVKTPQALAQRLQAPHVSLLYDIQNWIDGDHRAYAIYRPASIDSGN